MNLEKLFLKRTIEAIGTEKEKMRVESKRTTPEMAKWCIHLETCVSFADQFVIEGSGNDRPKYVVLEGITKDLRCQSMKLYLEENDCRKNYTPDLIKKGTISNGDLKREYVRITKYPLKEGEVVENVPIQIEITISYNSLLGSCNERVEREILKRSFDRKMEKLENEKLDGNVKVFCFSLWGGVYCNEIEDYTDFKEEISFAKTHLIELRMKMTPGEIELLSQHNMEKAWFPTIRSGCLSNKVQLCKGDLQRSREMEKLCMLEAIKSADRAVLYIPRELKNREGLKINDESMEEAKWKGMWIFGMKPFLISEGSKVTPENFISSIDWDWNRKEEDRKELLLNKAARKWTKSCQFNKELNRQEKCLFGVGTKSKTNRRKEMDALEKEDRESDEEMNIYEDCITVSSSSDEDQDGEGTDFNILRSVQKRKRNLKYKTNPNWLKERYEEFSSDSYSEKEEDKTDLIRNAANAATSQMNENEAGFNRKPTKKELRKRCALDSSKIEAYKHEMPCKRLPKWVEEEVNNLSKPDHLAEMPKVSEVNYNKADIRCIQISKLLAEIIGRRKFFFPMRLVEQTSMILRSYAFNNYNGRSVSTIQITSEGKRYLLGMVVKGPSHPRRDTDQIPYFLLLLVEKGYGKLCKARHKNGRWRPTKVAHNSIFNDTETEICIVQIGTNKKEIEHLEGIERMLIIVGQETINLISSNERKRKKNKEVLIENVANKEYYETISGLRGAEILMESVLSGGELSGFLADFRRIYMLNTAIIGGEEVILDVTGDPTKKVEEGIISNVMVLYKADQYNRSLLPLTLSKLTRRSLKEEKCITEVMEPVQEDENLEEIDSESSFDDE